MYYHQLLLLLGVTLVTFGAASNLDIKDISQPNNPESTQGSGQPESTQVENQTKTNTAAPGPSGTDWSPDTQTESSTESPGPQETENTTGIPRPTGRENDTSSHEPCLSICSPVRNAETLCSDMHPRNDSLFLNCVCASNNASAPIGLCAACKNQNGDNNNGKRFSLVPWLKHILIRHNL